MVIISVLSILRCVLHGYINKEYRQAVVKMFHVTLYDFGFWIYFFFFYSHQLLLLLLMEVRNYTNFHIAWKIQFNATFFFPYSLLFFLLKYFFHLFNQKPFTPFADTNIFSLINMSSENKQTESKPKPCCVCIEERKKRDECTLFKGIESEECKLIINQYTSCMKSYGFTPNPIN